MINRRTALKGMGAAGLAATFALRGIPLAQAKADAYPKLHITAKNFRFELPPSMPEGYTEITLSNQGEVDHHAMLMRLNPGVSVDDFMTTARDQDIGALFAISSSAGGPGSISAGQTSTVILDLKAGHYVVICIVPDAAGMPHYKMGMLAPLAVTAGRHAESRPVAQTSIDMVDFSFQGLPKKIPTGRHLWKVIDTSQQLHEMVVNRLAPGVSFEQAKTMLMAAPPEKPAEAAPFIAVAGVAPMSPGETAWAVLDLQAADYFAICFVPDAKTGAPHFALGMIMPFSVG